MRRMFNQAVRTRLRRMDVMKPAMVTPADLEHLPMAVRRYLNYVGVVGRERVVNFRMQAKGGIRNSPDYWMKFTSDQYNFYDEPSRFFYIKARKMGIPAVGLHAYSQGRASMVIKMLGLFKVVDARGPEMNQAETVTLFNDMCVMAPATLIDRSIVWEEQDDGSVRATFSNENITISATLLFNDTGQLINFISHDRYETVDGKSYQNYPWETPLFEYKELHGFRLATKADLIFRRREGAFCYGKFELTDVRYNVKPV